MLKDSSGQTTRAFTPDLFPPDSPNGIDLADERLARKEIEPGLQLKPFIGRIEIIIERISIIQPEGYVHARSAMLGAFLLGKEARTNTHDEVYGNRGVDTPLGAAVSPSFSRDDTIDRPHRRYQTG